MSKHKHKALLFSVLNLFFLSFVFSLEAQENENIHEYIESPKHFDKLIDWLHTKNQKQESQIIVSYEQALISLSNSLFDNEKKYKLNFELADYKVNSGEFEAAHHFLMQTMQAAEALNSEEFIARTHQSFAILFAQTNQSLKSISSFRSALDYFRKLPNSREYSYILVNLSVAYSQIGDLETAVDYLLTAQSNILEQNEINPSESNQRALMIIHLNLGEAYRELGSFDKAKENYNKTLEIARLKNDSAYIANVYNNFGILFIDSEDKNYDSALYYLDAAIEINVKQNRLPSVIRTYTNKALALMNTKRFDESIVYYTMLDSLSRIMNVSKGIYFAHSGLSKVYLEKNELSKALDHLIISYSIATSLEDKSLLFKTTTGIAELWEKMNNSDSALFYLKQSIQLKEDVDKQFNKLRLDEMLTRYESEVKEKENAILRASNLEISAQAQRRKMLLIGTLIFALVLVLFLAFLYRSYAVIKKLNNSLEKSNQEISNQNTALNQLNQDIQEKNSELDELNKLNHKLLRIISHDMRSPLASLSQVIELILTDTLEQEKARWMLEKLQQDLSKTTDLLNNLLNWAKSQLEGLKLYPVPCDILLCSNETIVLYDWWVKEKSIQVINKLPKNMCVIVDENMFKLILRNFYTNAIKFSQLGGTIELVGEKGENNTYRIGVRDYGVGIDQNKLASLFNLQTSSKGTANELGTGLGLYLSNEAALHSGGRVFAESTVNEGSTFWLELPIA